MSKVRMNVTYETASLEQAVNVANFLPNPEDIESIEIYREESDD